MCVWGGGVERERVLHIMNFSNYHINVNCCQFTLAFSISTSFDVGLLDFAAALRYWDLVVTDIWVWWFGVLRFIYIDVGIIIWVGLEFGTLVEMRLLVV